VVDEITLDNAGNVYVTGYSVSSGINFDYATLKYSPTGVVEEVRIPTDNAIFDVIVSPNPFHQQTRIRYSILDTGYVEQELRNSNFEMRRYTLKIYDASGRMVKSFNPESSIENLESEVIWDGTDQANREMCSGVYFVTCKVGDYQQMEKLLLIR